MKIISTVSETSRPWNTFYSNSTNLLVNVSTLKIFVVLNLNIGSPSLLNILVSSRAAFKNVRNYVMSTKRLNFKRL